MALYWVGDLESASEMMYRTAPNVSSDSTRAYIQVGAAGLVDYRCTELTYTKKAERQTG